MKRNNDTIALKYTNRGMNVGCFSCGHFEFFSPVWDHMADRLGKIQVPLTLIGTLNLQVKTLILCQKLVRKNFL